MEKAHQKSDEVYPINRVSLYLTDLKSAVTTDPQKYKFPLSAFICVKKAVKN